jgi:hypothetical protein
MGRLLAEEHSGMTAEPDRNVLAALLTKHAEITGQIERAQSELHKLMIALDNIEGTIWLFDPAIDLKTVKAKRLPTRHQAYRGEVARIVLGTLRKARGPIPAREIVAEVFAVRGLSAVDRALYRVITKRIGACLRKYRQKGIVVSSAGPHGAALWTLKP